MDYSFFKNINRNSNQFLSAKEDIVKTIDALDNDKSSDFWNLLEAYYMTLNKRIVKINSKSYNFINDKINESIEKTYFEIVINRSKEIKDDFPDFTTHITNLFVEKANLSSSYNYEYYLDSTIDSPIASIAHIGENRVIVIVNSSSIVLFRKDINKFNSIVLHEAAHVVQKDTKYLLKKEHFLSWSFVRKGFFNYLLSVSLILVVFTAFFIWIYIESNNKAEEMSMIDTRLNELINRTAQRQLRNKLLVFLIPIGITVFRFRRNIKRKNRLLSEYGADVFSMVKSRNTSLIKMLKNATHQTKVESKIHLPKEKRVDELLDLFTYAYMKSEITENNKKNLF